MDEIDPPIAGLPHPRAVQTLVGHTELHADMERAWRSGRLHHAILFSGPRGIGKASLAYRVAKMVLGGAADLDSAVQTDTERQIAGGAAQGFRLLTRGLSKEGKAKRQIGVDEVRAIEPFLRQRLGANAWRVVLIDAVNDLNASSANALLKILEEPGERTLFLLVAHGEGGVLPTIRSRCLLMRMAPLSTDQVGTVLEHSTLSPSHAKRSAALARGSVRRAVALAESGGTEAVDQIATLLSKPRWSAGTAQRVVDLAAKRGADTAFAIVAEELGRTLQKRAREARSPLHAVRLANAASDVSAALAEREEYGVDRALNLKGALIEAHRAVAG